MHILSNLSILVTPLAASWLFFRERVRPLEVAGIAAVLGGILLVILGE